MQLSFTHLTLFKYICHWNAALNPDSIQVSKQDMFDLIEELRETNVHFTSKKTWINITELDLVIYEADIPDTDFTLAV